MALFPVSLNARRRRLGRHLEKFNGDISAADHPIYSVFGSRMRFSGVGGSNCAMSGLTKFNRYVGKKQCARSN